jgi:hypothetical protein
VPVRPVTPDALIARVLAAITACDAAWVRVAIDGADPVFADPATMSERTDGQVLDGPGSLADALVAPLRALGRQVVRVRATDHLRPASLRFERGRRDPDSLYEDWLDEAGLVREVLAPLAEGGSGRIRPVRYDARRDRSARAGFVTVTARGVLLLSGPLLLGRGLPLDLAVHLGQSAATLARRTPPELAWTLPAYERYATEVNPASWADIVVRVDDPRHPALIEA